MKIESDNRVYYISGPMSGYEGYNYQYFEDVATQLRKDGLEIVSPHEIPKPPPEIEGEQKIWEWYMEQCMIQMNLCTDIILMKGWPESRGATTELTEAVRRRFPVWYYVRPNNELILMSRSEIYDASYKQA